MGKNQMRNIEIERVGNTQVNEFEYHQHQGEMTEQEHSQTPGAPDGRKLSRAEQVAQITEAAHRKVAKRKKKKPKPAAKATPKKSGGQASKRKKTTAKAKKGTQGSKKK